MEFVEYVLPNVSKIEGLFAHFKQIISALAKGCPEFPYENIEFMDCAFTFLHVVGKQGGLAAESADFDDLSLLLISANFLQNNDWLQIPEIVSYINSEDASAFYESFTRVASNWMIKHETAVYNGERVWASYRKLTDYINQSKLLRNPTTCLFFLELARIHQIPEITNDIYFRFTDLTKKPKTYEVFMAMQNMILDCPPDTKSFAGVIRNIRHEFETTGSDRKLSYMETTMMDIKAKILD